MRKLFSVLSVLFVVLFAAGCETISGGTKTMTFDELKSAIENSDLDENVKKEKIDALKKQSKK